MYFTLKEFARFHCSLSIENKTMSQKQNGLNFLPHNPNFSPLPDDKF